MIWYVTEPIEKERQRLDLSLGLRNSVWFFNNVPCPGIGSVFHPRLYTLSILGIYVAKELGLSPILVSNAIEALCMKLTYKATQNKADFHYRGSRAFGRDQENLSLNYLKLAKHYVTITYRQNTSRYLTNTYGIGLVKAGSRYSKYELSDSALEILSELNEGDRRYRDLLCDWVREGNTRLSVWKWLMMSNIQEVEKRIYNELHASTLPESSFFVNFKDLRSHNYEFLNDNENPKDVINKLDGDEKTIFEASLKFLQIKDRIDIEIRKAGNALEEHLHNSIEANGLSDDTMKLLQSMMKELEGLLAKLELRPHQKRFISDSIDFFSKLKSIDDPTRFLCLILERAPDFFVVRPNGKYRRAATYAKENFVGSLEENPEIIPYSVKNLKSQLVVLND